MDGKVAVYIGAENALSALGNSLKESFDRALAGETGLAWLERPFEQVERIFAGQVKLQDWAEKRILTMARSTVSGSLVGFDWEKHREDRWLLVLCTTKGDIDQLAKGNPAQANPYLLMEKIQNALPFKSTGAVVSCACISSLSGVIYAADRIEMGLFDHALVLGIDVLSEFTTMGFESFFALEAGQCRPFDAERKGLNLGEGAASAILSRSQESFAQVPFHYLAGATSNDANHISGPSRTGEGLVRAVQNTLNRAGRTAASVDFISAHGTGTPYNDDMESVAFSRLGMGKVPINSLKGYFGHTLGASGLLELGMSLQSMRSGVLLKTLGCAQPGTAEPVNLLLENKEASVSTLLKTASGFGGCNAAVLVGKV